MSCRTTAEPLSAGLMITELERPFSSLRALHSPLLRVVLRASIVERFVQLKASKAAGPLGLNLDGLWNL